MKSHRSALLGLVLGVTVLGMAACESKTEIIQPDPPIVVSLVPDAVSLAVGESVKLEAVVTGGGANTARTVTFSSSNQAVATVDANGNVTAVSAGVATITATSTADANARDASVITVGGGTGGAEPTISIKSITTGNLGTPVNTQNVAGQIDVTLNVDVPAGSQVTEVQTLIDGDVVCSQGFSAGSLVVAANPELGTEAQPVEIVCSVQTQAFNATTGAVSFPNGPHSLTAQLVSSDGSVVATPSTELVFNNTNFINVSFEGSKGPAISGNGPRSLAAAGSAWHGGDITFSVLPVNYGAAENNVASVTIQITSSGNGVTGVGGCTSTNDATTDPTIAANDGGNGGANFPTCAQASASKTVNTAAGAATEIVFPANATLTAGGVQNVEDIFTIAVNSVTTGGQAGPVCINPSPALNPQGPTCAGGAPAFPNPLRIDNLAPRITFLNIIRPNQYYNGAFVPNQGAQGVAAACPANTPCVRTVDYGVDNQTAAGNTTFEAGPATDALVDVTAGFSDLPETQVASTNLFSVTTMDALQNSRTRFATAVQTQVTTNANNALLFGIDNTDPTQAVAGPPDQSTNCVVGPSNPANCSPVAGWTITFSDAGVGPSGFNANPVTVKLERILASGTTCYDPNGGGPISCAANNNNGFVADDGIVTLPGATDGYWRLTAFVTDAANNQSEQTMILTLEDYTPPVAGGIASPATLTGGGAASFSSALVDNVELGDVLGATVYGGTITLVDSRQAIGTYGVDAINNTSPGTFNLASFVRSVETTDAVGLPTGTVQPATNFEYAARDVAGVELNTIVNDGCPAAGSADGTTTQNCILRTVDISAAVNLGSNNTFPAYTALVTANGLNAAHGLFVHAAPSNATVCTLATGNCTPSNTPKNTTLTATVTGPAAVFANPFSRVVFYMQDANGRWTPLGTGSVTVSDNTVLNTRTYTFSFVWTPTGLPGTPPFNANIVAVGINSTGSALVSQAQVVQLIDS